ncbi:hypothetical protein DFO67_108145 [Modicisalibacter xianhensis]|uniref:Uncharacterized protein n=1 Tax=Modicisalibacter xianhensis TaxID=442341 RepID=A0A4R8FRA4_9GAMM|nr:hypothetical protein [Halomonas xianhensis]TDX29101.1 hypothetical protein DFO67_108145 [Halomonas xianhensis]
MTFLELCQRLRQEVGAAGAGPASVTGQHGEYARLIGWIQQAWLEIQNLRTDWRFAWAEGAITMEDGFRDYALPDDFASFIADTIYLDDAPLTLLPYRIFRRHYRNASPSRPRHITVTPGDVLRLAGALQIDAPPGEGEVLTFEYYRTPQALTANSDVPRMPEPYHMLIVYKAMVQYGLFENAPEVVQQGNSQMQPLLTELHNRELPGIDMPGALA